MERIGTIAHYWPRAEAAELVLENRDIHVGDRIRIVGHGHDFTQRVNSIQVNHDPRTVGHAGEPVGIAVADRVHENDDVYLITEEDEA